MSGETSAIIGRLSKAFHGATRSAHFSVNGKLPIRSEIEVEGVGRLTFRLKPAEVKSLISRCKLAPFGKGEKTLVETEVRRTFELDPKHFKLGDKWESAIRNLMDGIAVELGLPAGQLEPKLYKLLVYQRGGFFAPHRDSEKHDRMVASMIVVLPNIFEGRGSRSTGGFDNDQTAASRRLGAACGGLVQLSILRPTEWFPGRSRSGNRPHPHYREQSQSCDWFHRATRLRCESLS